MRPKPNASCATPVQWSEVSDPKLKPDMYTITNMFKRLEKIGDPWESIHTTHQLINQSF